MTRTAKKLTKLTYIWLVLPVGLALGAWQGWSWWSWVSAPVIDSSQVSNPPQIQIEIAPGTGSQQIGNDLQSAGLIRSSTAWRIWYQILRWQDRQGEFKSGTYTLSPTKPLRAIAEQIWRGQVAKTSYTIPEGWSLRQMATYFESQGFFPASGFMDAAKQIPRDRFPWLPEGIPHLEGFLIPDTYVIDKDSITPQAVINQMLNHFQTKALPIYEQQKGKTQLGFYDWVKLASIVEKESVLPTERRTIAGVFTERLRRGMKLEADPTVEYGLGIRQTADQPLTYAQVQTANPYNTYMNPGLTPTPIANPGLASLKATLDPEKTEYLFFVARYDGSHVFSKTLEEHEAAAIAIRRQRDSQRPSPNPQ
jgi:UPF0755 protein